MNTHQRQQLERDHALAARIEGLVDLDEGAAVDAVDEDVRADPARGLDERQAVPAQVVVLTREGLA